MGMTSNGFTLADPNDREMLDVLVPRRRHSSTFKIAICQPC